MAPGIAAAVAVLFWLDGRQAAGVRSQSAPAVSSAERFNPPAGPLPHPAPATAVAPPAVALPVVDPVADPVHLKLRQLLDLKTGDAETETALTAELLAAVADDTLATVVQSLSPEELDTHFGTAALARWLGADSLAAANWIATRPDATEAQAWLVAHQLIGDPAGLRDYCDRLPDSEWKQDVLTGAGLAVLAKNPVEAVGLAQRMEAGAARQNLLETIACDWTSRDPATALAWIEGVADSALRERLLAVGAKAMAAADPDLAAGWLGAAVKLPDLLDDTAVVVAETWAAQNPAAAAKWVAQFPEHGPREAAVALVSRRWLQVDPGAATAWIQTLPEREKIFAGMNSAPPESPPDPQ